MPDKIFILLLSKLHDGEICRNIETTYLRGEINISKYKVYELIGDNILLRYQKVCSEINELPLGF